MTIVKGLPELTFILKITFCFALWYHQRMKMSCLTAIGKNSNGKSVISRHSAVDFPPIRMRSEMLYCY